MGANNNEDMRITYNIRNKYYINMKTNYKFFIFLEIISFLVCLIILIDREFKFDIINIILFLGIISSTYKLVQLLKKNK